MDEQDTPDGYSRRAVLAGAAGLSGVLAATGAGWHAPAGAVVATRASGVTRAQITGAVIDLTLDGVAAATPLWSVEGGHPVAEVIHDPGNTHIGNVKYEEIIVQCGINLGGVKTWLRDTVKFGDVVRSGTIRFMGDEAGTLKFTDAVISGFSFPASDASSKDPSYMTLKLAPTSTVLDLDAGATPGTAKARPFIPANFKVEMEGIDTSGVTSADGFTFGGDVDLDTIKLRLEGSTAGDWVASHEDFVINGNNGPAFERSGSVTYFGNGGSPVLNLGLREVGIFGLGLAPASRALEKIEIAVELYGAFEWIK